jgi:hypothetical protein
MSLPLSQPCLRQGWLFFGMRLIMNMATGALVMGLIFLCLPLPCWAESPGGLEAFALQRAAVLKAGDHGAALLDGIRSVSATVCVYAYNPDAEDSSILDSEGISEFLLSMRAELVTSALAEPLQAKGFKVNDAQFPIDADLSLVVIQDQPAPSSAPAYVVFLMAKRNLFLGGLFADSVPTLVWESDPIRISLGDGAAAALAIRSAAKAEAAAFGALCVPNGKPFVPRGHYRDLR